MTEFLEEYFAVDESGGDELRVDANGNMIEEDEQGTLVPEYVRMHLEHEELTARITNLSQELTERRSEALKELVASIVGWMDNYGLGRFEVMAELRKIIGEPKAKTKGKTKPKPAPRKVTLFADAACPGQIYKRGPYPRWMRERMVSLGLNPADIKQRQAYRDAHLKAVG